MTTDPKPTMADIQALSERTRETIPQLRAIGGLPIPRARKALVANLIDNAQLYLVFLEESAKHLKEGKAVNAATLIPITNHCDLVEKARLEVQKEFERQEQINQK